MAVQHFVEHSLQPVAIYDRTLGHFVDCNQKLVKLFEYPNKEELLSLSLVNYLCHQQFDDLIAEDLIDKVLNHFNENEVFMSSILGKKKDGSAVILEMCALRNYLGAREQTIFFFSEIDETYLAHKAVLEKNMIYKTIIQSAFDYIDIHEVIVIDPKKMTYDGILVDRSSSMKLALGIENQALVTSDALIKLTHPTFLKKNKHRIDAIIKTLVADRNVQFDWEFVKQDKSVVSLSVDASLVHVKDKLILVRIMRNISSKIRQQRLIEQQNEELREKNQRLEAYIESNTQLENFAHIASHDMKAPLRSIYSFANILFKKLQPTLSNSDQHLFDYIIKGSKDLSLLIDDLLSFSKVTNQKLNKDLIQTSLFLTAIQEKLTIPIREKNVQIILKKLLTAFMGDELKILRVFQNLIQNSIKFSKPDVPSMISITGDEDQKYWYFSVEKNGIGIKPEFQEFIFLMFRKLNGQKYAGSGMGLALCKKIIEQHDGDIRVVSTFQKGAKFTFSIKK